MEGSWVTRVWEHLIRGKWEIVHGQEKGRQGKGHEVRVGC